MKCPVCKSRMREKRIFVNGVMKKEKECTHCPYTNKDIKPKVKFCTPLLLLLLIPFVSGVTVEGGAELAGDGSALDTILAIARNIVGWFVVAGFLLNLIRAKYSNAYNRKLLYLSLLGCFFALLMMAVGDLIVDAVISLRMSMGGG